MSSATAALQTIFLEFQDNQKLSTLVGPHDHYLLHLEQRLGIMVALRGNRIAITGLKPEIIYAKKALEYLYNHLIKGHEIDIEEVEAAIRFASIPAASEENRAIVQSTEGRSVSIATQRRIVFPRSTRQAAYVEAMQHQDLIFSEGPAGTGKTYLAIAMGVSLLLSGQVDRLILSRPAVEAGERLGFLPGDMREKIDPYLRPMYDALHDILPPDQVFRRLSNGEIEIAPLAFMRGRTLANAFIVLDEAQNTTPVQMKMFLTRLGSHARMVITGDLTQIDLPIGALSGLKHAIHTLQRVTGISFITFDETDVVRHPLVTRIIKAYQKASCLVKEEEGNNE